MSELGAPSYPNGADTFNCVAPDTKSLINLICPKSVSVTAAPIRCFRTVPVVSTPCRDRDLMFVRAVPTKSQEICSFVEFELSRVKKYRPDGNATPSSSVADESVAVVPPIAISVERVVVKSFVFL